MQSNRTQSDAMVASLAAVRRRIRWLLSLEAAGRILVLCAVYALGLASADWWVHFPGYVRLIFGITFLSLVGRYAYLNVYIPAIAPIHLDQVALSMSALPPDLRDRLAASVSYLDHGGPGSAVLWHELIDQTADALVRERIIAGVKPTRARRWLAAGLLSLVPIVVLFAWQRETAQVGLARLAAPLSDSNWPRRVEIAAITGDAVVAMGDSFEVAMRVSRGDSRLHRAYLNFHLPDGRLQREVLRRGADGSYRRTIDNIRADVRYSFTFGDHDLSVSPFTLRASARPAVLALSADVWMPDYAGATPAESQSAEDAGLRAIEGGRIRLRAVCNKRIDLGAGGAAAALVFEDGRRVSLSAGSGAELGGEFPAVASTTFSIELTDELGLKSPEGRRYSLTVRPDVAPVVRIVQPSGLIEVTPRAELVVVVAAEDDVGIESLVLLASKADEPQRIAADLLHEDGLDGSSERRESDEADEATASNATDSAKAPEPSKPLRRIERTHPWMLSTHDLRPGDVVVACVEARDAYRHDGQARAPVRSLPIRLNVISPSDMANRLREELLLLQRSLRPALAELGSIEARTQQLQSELAERAGLSDSQQRRAQRMAGEIDRVAQSIKGILGRLDGLIDRGYANRLGHDESVQQARRASSELAVVQERQLGAAAGALTAVAGAPPEIDSASLVSTALNHEAEAIVVISGILDRLTRWNNYEELVRRVRELLDRQEALIRVVADRSRTEGENRADSLGGDGLGGAAAPSGDEPDGLRLVAQDQKQLGMDASRVFLGMKEVAESSQQGSSARALALSASADVGYRHNVIGRMEEAAVELSANRAGLAGDAQANAAAGLRAMIALLEEEPRRELALLSKALTDAADRLKKIVAAQRDLIVRTESATDNVAPLATRQSTLARTTGSFAAGFKAPDAEGESAREQIASAAQEMESAAGDLAGNSRATARPHQDTALELLVAVLAALENRREQAEQALAEKSLAALTERLVEIHREQGAIRADTESLGERSAGATRLARPDLLRLNRLVTRQTSLQELLDEARSKLSTSIVFNHVSEKVSLRMGEAAKRVEQREWTHAITTQDLILADLRRLIGAIEELPRPDPGKQFADSAGAGQSAAQPTMERLIPPLAELKVLRAIQQDLNQQTMQVARKGPGSADEVEQVNRELSAVASGQREVYHLASQLIEQAASQGGAP